MIFYSLHYLITRLLGAQLCERVYPNPKEYKQVVREEVMRTNVCRALPEAEGLMPPKGGRKSTITQHMNIKTHTQQVFQGTKEVTRETDRNMVSEIEQHVTHFP